MLVDWLVMLYGNLRWNTQSHASLRHRLILLLLEDAFSLGFVLIPACHITGCRVPTALRLRPLPSKSIVYLDSHLVNVLLSVFNHLDCLFPLCLELMLRSLNLLSLQTDPLLQRLLALSVGPWRELPVLEHLADELLLLRLPVLQCLLPHFYQVHVIIVFHHRLKLLHSVLLEGVPVEDWIRWMTKLVYSGCLGISRVGSIRFRLFDFVLVLSLMEFEFFLLSGHLLRSTVLKLSKQAFTSSEESHLVVSGLLFHYSLLDLFGLFDKFL